MAMEDPREHRDVSMNAYIRKQAAKEIVRTFMEEMGSTFEDPVPYAKVLYEKKAISKLTLELAEPSDFPIGNRATSFLSSMYSSIDRNHANFGHLLDTLRLFPDSAPVADKMEKAYADKLVEYELERFIVLPPLFPTLEKAIEAFSGISYMQDQMWKAAKEFVLKEVQFDTFKKFMMYTIIDAREEVKHDHITTFEQLFEIAATKMDVTNVVLIESLIFEHRVEEIIAMLNKYQREREYFYQSFLFKHYAFLLDQPGYQCALPDAREPIMIRVDWDFESITMAQFIHMMEAAFSSLSKHMYLYRVDKPKQELHFYCSKWITLALAKLTRERSATLRAYNVKVVTIGVEIALLDLSWGITDADTFEFMEYMLLIMKGRIDEVHDEIEGINNRKRRDAIQYGKPHFTPPDPTLPHSIFRMTDFANHVHLNDLWVSPPFYSGHPGYKLCICANANGVGMGRGTHLSVCVTLMKGEYDDELEWPFRGRVTIRMRNLLIPTTHVVGMFEFDEFIRQDACERVTGPGDFAPIGLGNHLFASHADMEYDMTRNRHYLKHDCIELEVCDIRVGLDEY